MEELILKKGDKIVFNHNQALVVTAIYDYKNFKVTAVTPALDTIYHIQAEKPYLVFPQVEIEPQDCYEVASIAITLKAPRAIINQMEIVRR